MRIEANYLVRNKKTQSCWDGSDPSVKCYNQKFIVFCNKTVIIIISLIKYLEMQTKYGPYRHSLWSLPLQVWIYRVL